MPSGCTKYPPNSGKSHLEFKLKPLSADCMCPPFPTILDPRLDVVCVQVAWIFLYQGKKMSFGLLVLITIVRF